MAGGQGKPYFMANSRSRLPALTPMRMGMPRALALRSTWRKRSMPPMLPGLMRIDRKSTRLNSSHANISYAVFCLKKKNNVRSTSHNIYMGENSFEALFRALYLDRGDNDCIIFLHNRTLYILIIIYKESYK